MENNRIIMSNRVLDKNKEISLEIALYINKNLYEEQEITYKMYKYTEDIILRQIKNNCRNNKYNKNNS